MRLVLYVGWPCALALVVYVVGLRLSDYALPPGRRISTVAYGKFEALSICVQSVTGERREAEQARELVDAAVTGLGLPGPRLFTLPANTDAGCPGDPAHFGASAKARRVADRMGGRGATPSPYQLHVYLMPPVTLQTLRLEPQLADRRLMVEEYAVEGSEPQIALTGVTFGLYASTAELADRQALQRYFNRALLMQSQLGAPPRSRI